MHLVDQHKECIIDGRDVHKPHGLGYLHEHIVFSDPANHQIKQIHADDSINVLAGSGKSGRKYGPAMKSSMTQPTSIIVEGGK